MNFGRCRFNSNYLSIFVRLLPPKVYITNRYYAKVIRIKVGESFTVRLNEDPHPHHGLSHDVCMCVCMRLSVIGNNQRGKQGFITESQMTNKRLPHQQQQQQTWYQQRRSLRANRNLAGEDGTRVDPPMLGYRIYWGNQTVNESYSQTIDICNNIAAAFHFSYEGVHTAIYRYSRVQMYIYV